MQPYPNPNYYTQYQQQFNPYMQRMENLQQFQQSLNPAPQAQPFTPLGKMVESVDIVKVTDIPMDGNVYYFPKADGEEIYTKQFMPNGQTRILTFKPITDDNHNNLPLDEEKTKFDTFNAFLEGIQADIKTLSDKVDKILKPNRAKKEVDADE